MKIHLTPDELALAETLRNALYEANALSTDHAYDSHTFGLIKLALLNSLETSLRLDATTRRHAKEIARRLYLEAIDNGENIAYQIELFNEGVIEI